MPTRRYLLLICSLLILLLFAGCPDKPCATCPDNEPTTCEYPEGNRNFTWRVDTVAWYPSWLGGVHAFSDTDAWVMGGMNGSKGEDYVGLHWNGEEWDEKIDFFTIYMNPNDVAGDDHFMVSVGYRLYVGVKPGIAEFDNQTKQWKYYQYQITGELLSVWTDGKGYFIAVGANGMVFTKDGYSSDWIYQKAPTDFYLTDVVGISKNEIYIHSGLSLATGEDYHQYWKFNGVEWIKLYDEQDSTGTYVKLQGTENSMIGIAAARCSITDSLKLYLIGWESFLLESKEHELNYTITNLSTLGLPLRNLGRTAFRISLFSPDDYWIFGTRYNFYHWNGSDFQKIIIPGLPNDDIRFGYQHKMVKTKTGKIFLPSEVGSQVYVVVQGTP